MERFRQLWGSIVQRLSVLSMSQRLAIALCAALVGVSFLWLMQWSTTPELMPLVSHDFDTNQLDAAEKALKTSGVVYELQGNRIYVRGADRHNALRLLHSANALPEGSLYDMASVVNDPNPFLSPEAREYAQNYAKGNELAKVLSSAPFVQQASVIINPRARRRLGGSPDVPTASVAVTLQPGQEMTDAIVDGFAKLVAGTVSGLKPHNVYVTDSRTGRTFNVPHPDDPASFDMLGLEKKRETHLRDKIIKKLADIPGVQVEVSVELDTSKRVTQRIKHDAPQTKTESSVNSEQGGGAAATEPGVQANLGQAVTESGGSTGQTNEETKVENFEPKVAQTETVEQIPFAAKNVTAAIGIPRSFIVSIFKARYADQKDPQDDNEKFKAIRDEQVARVKTSVGRIVMAKTPADVEVDIYPDFEWTADGGTWSRAPAGVATLQAGSAPTAAMDMVRDYGPHLGLAALALTSLFMMLRIVRRAPLPTPLIPTGTAQQAASAAEEPLLTVGPKSVGKAGISESLLTGREVDEDTLRYQELGEEVSRLVQEDPESAAHLISRWMKQN